jgi:hypothetical protein
MCCKDTVRYPIFVHHNQMMSFMLIYTPHISVGPGSRLKSWPHRSVPRPRDRPHYLAQPD